jgi:hypothetical protein
MHGTIPGNLPKTAPNLPKDPEDAARWTYLRKVRRILYGEWREDLRQQVKLQVGGERESAWRCPDLSANFYRSAWDALARSYDLPPIVTHNGENAQGLIGPEGAIAAAGLWPMMQRTQRDTLGMREMFMRVDAVQTDNGPVLTYRPVFPDYVTVVVDADRPDVPVKLCESRMREINTISEKGWNHTGSTIKTGWIAPNQWWAFRLIPSPARTTHSAIRTVNRSSRMGSTMPPRPAECGIHTALQK